MVTEKHKATFEKQAIISRLIVGILFCVNPSSAIQVIQQTGRDKFSDTVPKAFAPP
jgi:hypothetical protein